MIARSCLGICTLALSAMPAPAQESGLDKQIDTWAAQNKVAVTRQVREELAWMIRAEAYKTAAGPNAVLPAVRPGQSEQSANASFAENLEPSRRSTFYDLVKQLSSLFSINSKMNGFPTIEIAVRPDPPRDFAVEINGETAPSDASTYKVPGGSIVVRVTRSGRAPCSWRGWLAGPQEKKTINCEL
jgi:hypothetical protein